MVTYYKSLRPNMASWHDDKFVWALGVPTAPIDGPKGEPCGPGYHLAKRPEDATGYGKFPLRLFEAEPCGDLLGEDNTKVRFTSAKITREIDKPMWVIETENFIASIAKVKFFPKRKRAQMKNWKVYPTRYAARAAAGDAARAAAGDAAGDAAGAAAWAAAWAAARAAARADAWAAAWDAARDAAGYAAWDAAGYAARDAAGAAARAAAGAAARAAARDAAWDAARDAALMARMSICRDLKMDPKLRKHARDSWEVWTRGYGLACNVNGVLYVYKNP